MTTIVQDKRRATSASDDHLRTKIRNGGAEVFMMDLLATVPYYTAYLSRALLAKGARVTIGSITYYLDRDCFTQRGLRLQPGPMNIVGGLNLSPGPRRILKLAEMTFNLMWQTIRFALRPTAIVHVQFLPLLRWPLPLDLWFVLFCQWRGSRIVLTVHDLLPHDTADRYKTIFDGLYGKANALICHSEHVRDRLRTEFRVSDEKISVIPHGPFFFDLASTSKNTTRERLVIPEGRKVVLWQGIIFPYKGLDHLLAAWDLVEQRSDAGHLIVLGTGSSEMLANVRAQVARLGLQRVTLDLRFASTEELVEAYRAADVVVYPYRAITTSGALATGLALGKAIVASDLPVFRELLSDGQNARLVPPGNDAALATALVNLLEDDVLRQRFIESVSAMNFAQQSWGDIAERTIAVYADVLGPQSKDHA